jgi:hypothetical protein
VRVSKRKRVSGASHPLRLRIVGYGRFMVRDQRAKAEQPLIVPMRPIATGGMCCAQRMDLQAAIAGKITWAEYNRKGVLTVMRSALAQLEDDERTHESADHQARAVRNHLDGLIENDGFHGRPISSSDLRAPTGSRPIERGHQPVSQSVSTGPFSTLSWD